MISDKNQVVHHKNPCQMYIFAVFLAHLVVLIREGDNVKIVQHAPRSNVTNWSLDGFNDEAKTQN